MIQRLNVDELREPPGYTEIAIVDNAKLVFIAGQMPIDPQGNLIGGDDPVEQGKQCLRNVAACLSAVGAEPTHIVRTTVYVVPNGRMSIGDVWDQLLSSEWGTSLRPPGTLVGVAGLAYAGQLVEIECTAAIPAQE